MLPIEAEVLAADHKHLIFGPLVALMQRAIFRQADLAVYRPAIHERAFHFSLCFPKLASRGAPQCAATNLASLHSRATALRARVAD